jgi:release factor glutamine methyltransferase
VTDHRSVDEIHGVVAARLRQAGIESPRFEARLLVAHAMGAEPGYLLGHPDHRLAAEEAEAAVDFARRRANREPMAYITGRREFWSLDFRVTPDTLIPRPDSETLIEATLEGMPSREASLSLLDLGTGSGCLLLALLSELPGAVGFGVDINPAACAVARSNAVQLGLGLRASFVTGHWAEALGEARFDLAVVNPPYVPLADAATMDDEITRFEPSAAVFAEAGGLAAYEALAPSLNRVLRPGGRAVIELGAGQAEAVQRIFVSHGFEAIDRRRDLSGHWRCLALSRPSSVKKGLPASEKKRCKLGADS